MLKRRTLRHIRLTYSVKGLGRYAFIIALLFTLWPISVFSQAPLGIFADSNHPLGAPGVTPSTSVWHVDVLTGALSVKIPIAQGLSSSRGHSGPMAIVYNSAGTIRLKSRGISYLYEDGYESGAVMACNTFADRDSLGNCYEYSSSTDPLGHPNGVHGDTVEQFQWVSGDMDVFVMDSQSATWGFTTPGLTYTDVNIPDQIYWVQSSGGYSNPGIEVRINLGNGSGPRGPYLYRDGDGGVHDLNIEGARPPGWDGANYTLPVGQTPQPRAPTGSTTDGSSITSVIDPATVLPKISLPDGSVSITSQGVLAVIGMKDSNGNITSWSGTSPSSITDPLNRQEVTYSSTSYSVNNKFALSAKGVGGVVHTYNLTWEQIGFSAFTMPHPTTDEIQHVGQLGAISAPGVFRVSQLLPGTQPDPGTLHVLQELDLPDQTSYKFQYDPVYGTMTRIDLPSGGYVRFVWGIRGIGERGVYGIAAKSTLVVTDEYVSTGNGPESHWHYSYADLTTLSIKDGQFVYPVSSVSVTQPDQSTVAYTGNSFDYSSLYHGLSSPTWQNTSTVTTNSSGTIVESTTVLYDTTSTDSTFGRPVQQTDTLYGGASPIQKQTQYAYDAWNNITEKDESDFYTCTGSPCPASSSPSNGWLKKTEYRYLYSNPTSSQPTFDYTSSHILDKPSQISVFDGSGHLVAQQQYIYDEFPLQPRSGVTQHDDTGFPASFIGPRGNVTTERRCSSISANACTTWVQSTKHYDQVGNLVTATDFGGNTYTYDYTDAYPLSAQPSPTAGYVTSFTRPSVNGVTHVTAATYDFSTGVPLSQTGENGEKTSLFYVNASGITDPFDRLQTITSPPQVDGATGTTGSPRTDFIYVDTPGARSLTRETKQHTTGSTMTEFSLFDGLGRVVQHQNTSGATTDTTYDLMGRVQSVSNPYFSTLDPTYGLTTFQYDPLGRKLIQCQPDNGTGSGTCVAGTSYLQWSYNGNASTSTDEDGDSWTRSSDGLGRLTSVVEPGTRQTTYSYDSLGNLKCVDQWGATQTVGTACASDRARSFTYDSLSRLISSTNPEPGTIGYSYDSNGNLLTKTSPLANAASGTQTVHYGYDALNRLVQRGYPVLPAASKYFYSCYQYDSSSVAGASNTAGNFIGRLANSWTQISISPPLSFTCPSSPPTTALSRHSVLAYDALGHLLNEQQCTAASCGGTVYSPSYTYDLVGNIITHSSAIPSGVGSFVLTNNYDSAAQLTSVTSSNALYPTTLFTVPSSTASSGCNATGSSPGYGPAGGLMNATFGIGLQLSRSYDLRLRTNCEKDTGNSVPNSNQGTAAIVINGTDQTH